MKIRDAILADALPLPPIPSDLAYQFVIAGNGLFIRAEDSRMEALVPVALADVHGLEPVEPCARLKMPRVCDKWLWAILRSAKAKLPNEAMYQFIWDTHPDALNGGEWRCLMPAQETGGAHAHFSDRGDAVIDLHSHASMSAFFSETDDRDEQGLRFYAVIGQVETNTPQIAMRVGIYGHTMNVPATVVFAGLGPFAQVDPEIERVLMEDEVEKAKLVE